MSKLTIASNYGVAPNELLNNNNLSLKAKGLFVYLQSKPDDWKFSTERIPADHSNGESSISEAIKELEKAGYIKRQKYQNNLGHWHINYILYSTPHLENRVPDLRVQDCRVQDNRGIYKERYTKKDIQRKKEIKEILKKEFISQDDEVEILSVDDEHGLDRFGNPLNKIKESQQDTDRVKKIKSTWLDTCRKNKVQTFFNALEATHAKKVLLPMKLTKREFDDILDLHMNNAPDQFVGSFKACFSRHNVTAYRNGLA